MRPGTHVGHYEILAAIGKGGMGEVWKARDTTLGREVAIKTLPAEFARDTERVARFEREARLLASLNHPKIAAVYGFQEHGGTHFLVMEMAEGDTLAERLKPRAIPVEESLALALQIAEALEAAHEKGVIHRDLKPANIKIIDEGMVKVLDFGLAKAFAGDTAEASASNSPTLSMQATQQGLILGTAAYMAPEQAKGRETDKRADIWAFGCVLFEMLTGAPAFDGEDVSEILASVIKAEVKLGRLPERLNPDIRRLIARCLEKDRKQRFRDIGDVRFELVALQEDPEGLRARRVAGTVGIRPRRFAAAIAATVVVTAVLAATGGWLMRPDPPGDISRFSDALPEGRQPAFLSLPTLDLSPDGRSVVYAATDGLYLRSLTEDAYRLIPGSEGTVNFPFFSPDGAWVGYFDQADRWLKKISTGGGLPIPLTETSTATGASWSADGVIVFAQDDGIYSVSEDGGTPELLVPARDGEDTDLPRMLPGGDWILFGRTTATGPGRWDRADIVAESLVSKERRLLVRGGSDARYVSTGHLVYAQGNVLLAVPFDLDRIAAAGDSGQVVAGVQRGAGGDPVVASGTAHYGVSDQGTLVYLAEFSTGVTTERRLGLADRDGSIEFLDARPLPYLSPRISADGRIAVETLSEDGTSDIWIYDTDGDREIQQLTQEGSNTRPVWTPESERVTFTSDRSGTRSIWWRPADGSGVAEPLTRAEEGVEHWPESWSPGGRTLAFTATRSNDLLASAAIWTLSLDGSGEPELFYDFPGTPETGALFSPNGNWLTYFSREATGLNEVWIQPFPSQDGANKHRLTFDGGTYPLWSSDGRSIFYRRAFSMASDSALMETDVDTEPAVRFGAERVLPIQDFLIFNFRRDYDLAPDGRFLMVFPAGPDTRDESVRPEIKVVLNWTLDLLERVPVD